MRPPNRAEIVQRCLEDVTERIFAQGGLDHLDKAALFKRVAHKCFEAAKVLEE